MGETIKIEGFVEIRNGATVIKAKNKFVQTTLQHILNFLSLTGSVAAPNFNGPSNTFNMYVGTDTVTATVYNTTALTAPIGGAPGTAPNSIGAVTSNPSNGVFQIVMTAVWNAGSLPGNPTVGEMALYLNLFPAGTLEAYGWIANYLPGAAVLGSRLAAGDAAFTPFVVNSANPLSIVWTIQFSFV